MLRYIMESLAQINYMLEQLGVSEYLNIVDNEDEVKQLMNKIGRPDLFNQALEYLKEEEEDPPYEFAISSDEEVENESECSTSDLVEEQYQVNPCGNGFFELDDVELKYN